MRNFLVIFILIIVCSFSAIAQGELNCSVSIDAESIESTEKDIFQQLKSEITQFMNNRKWTEDEFLPEERITCNLIITITSYSGNNYQATAMVQSSRPMFNTNKETVILKFLDRRFNFSYTEGQALNYSENTFTDNLTGMLSFYAYVILGLDYDSFGKLGGTKYLEKARDLALMAQTQVGDAWDPAQDPNNRYWLITNLNNQQFIPFTEGLYSYHRLGLDKFLINPEESRKEVTGMLDKLKGVYNLNPSSVVIKNFFNAKVDELVNIYQKAAPEVKEKVVPTLKLMDPLNSEKYNKILKL